MIDVCKDIVEASRRYTSSVEGLVWDRILEAAPVLQAYVLRGEAIEGVDDKWAARILWAMLAIWGNVKSLVSAERCCICCLEPWLSEGAKLIKRLRTELSDSVKRLASVPEAPSQDDINLAVEDVKRVYNAVKDTLCLGDVAATKTIAFLTLFHLPPVDSEIVELVTGRKLSGPDIYIEAIKALTRILSECMRNTMFRGYIAERRASGSLIHAKPFKVIDEGLWWLLHREREEVKDQVYNAIREMLQYC